MKLLKYIVIFICFIPLLLCRDFTPNNELKYLSIGDEALLNEHFFTFWNHGILYADKPPLYLWIVMLGKWLLGTHCMFFLNLFSLLPALAILYIMDKWVKNILDLSIRNSGQLMLITSGLFVGSAIVLRMDMLMCMFIVLALYTFYKLYTHQNNPYDSFKLPLYIFGAIFTKGPVGLLVPFLTIFFFLLIKKELKDFGKYFGWKSFGILSGLCIVWFIGVYWEGGIEYLNNLLFNQTVNRAIDSFHHKEPFWYYFKTISYSLAPWTLFYLFTILKGVKKHLINNDLKKYFLTIILTTFITLSISSAKLDIYLLPIFPFIAYLTFLLLPEINTKYLWVTIALPAFILLFTFPGLYLAAPYIDIPIFPNKYLLIAAGILSGSAGICLYFLSKKQFLCSVNSIAIGMLLTIFIGGFAIPKLNPYIGFGKMAQAAQDLAYKNKIENFYYYKFRSGKNLDAYLNKNIISLNIEEIHDLLHQQDFILFIKETDLKKDTTLSDIIQDYNKYKIGDYNIILFQHN